jgi:hypothetical protein
MSTSAQDLKTPSSSTPHNSPASSTSPQIIQPNSIYISFNAPEVDEYHRGIFITNPSHCLHEGPSLGLECSTHCDNLQMSDGSGTLIHAIWTVCKNKMGPGLPESGIWSVEKRRVCNIQQSKTLVLLFRIGELPSTPLDFSQSLEKALEEISRWPLQTTPERMAKKGNPALGGYSCIIWLEDIFYLLCNQLDHRTFHISRGKNWDRKIERVMDTARDMAGPADARTMVGKHVPGEFRVVNNFP